jgi:hypothetical protein
MSGFDITFELFTLLLGLAMAEVLAGYVRTFKLRSRIRNGRGGALAQVRVGWLIPLTAAIVICHQATFWLFMFEMQDSMPLNFLSLIAVLIVIGWYYLISAALWPEEPELWPDFDDYYVAHRRFIWWGVIAIALIAEAGRAAFGVTDPAIAAVEAAAPRWIADSADVADVGGTIALLAMPFVRSRRIATILLIAMVAHFAVLAAASPWITL